ncbi:MAG: gamma-glutamyltransferase [Rhizobiales bacterium]|nr:gamma-glutamyltransferase [Hyphomicrobiales bacterium]
MRRILLALLTALHATFALAQEQASDQIAPEAATPVGSSALSDAGISAALKAKADGKPVTAKEWMVVAANPLAVRAGADVLAKGGTAADAMVAVQTVLGLVEPQSSGLGGGAFLVWYDATTGDITTLDGRETAPLEATPKLFLDDTGEPLQFFDAVVGGRSVGTPGTPMLMEEAHRRWGRANWAGLFDDAIALAENGFEVSPRMAASIAGDAERLSRYGNARDYFLPGGEPLAEGTKLANPAYADTLRQIAEGGAKAFYEGPIAADIVRTVREAEGNPGVLSLADFSNYEIKARPPVCVTYRAHDVCGMGPPSSGGLTVGQILKLVEPFDLSGVGAESEESWRLIGDASRLAFADRERYMADADFVPVPVKGLVDDAYMAARAKLLETDKALETVEAGMPAFDHALNWADGQAIELPSTSHISIVDRYGNALSMTTTIENGFGSRLMVRGFLLNNELTDFSFRTHVDGVPVANRVEPGKRPRSSMAPTIVLKDGKPEFVVGSPGGSQIIGYVAQAIINRIDWGMDPQQAVSAPHLVNRFGPFDVEAGTPAEQLRAPLEALGYEVRIGDINSGLHAIAITPDGLQGGADPRREGIALGE